MSLLNLFSKNKVNEEEINSSPNFAVVEISKPESLVLGENIANEPTTSYSQSVAQAVIVEITPQAEIQNNQSNSPKYPNNGNKVLLKMSYYNPYLGGTNCSNFYNGYCHSKMASGQRWEDWFNKNAIACPMEFPFWTKISIDGVVYTCLDRGGAIVQSEGVYWVDVLTDKPIYKFGSVVEGYILE